MLFHNLDIDISELPGVEAQSLNSLDSNYLYVNSLKRLLMYLVVCTAVSLAMMLPSFDFLLSFKRETVLVLGSFLVVHLVYGYFLDQKKTYSMREHDITFNSGMVHFKSVTQPFLRIQHIEIRQDFAERLFGLASLKIYSAGGSSHTFDMPGLTSSRAKAVKQYILKKCHSLSESSLFDEN